MGFEPTIPGGIPVFETGAFVRSAISPRCTIQNIPANTGFSRERGRIEPRPATTTGVPVRRYWLGYLARAGVELKKTGTLSRPSSTQRIPTWASVDAGRGFANWYVTGLRRSPNSLSQSGNRSVAAPGIMVVDAMGLGFGAVGINCGEPILEGHF